MLVLNSEAVRSCVTMSGLVSALEDAFRRNYVVPARQIAEVPGGNRRLFVSMPTFDLQGGIAVKLATLFPDNPSRNLPSVQATIVVFNAMGTPSAILDGTSVTHLRTGAASALASRYLSRPDSSRLVIIGTGALAPNMAAAHCAVRPISKISVWGRRPDRATATSAAIRCLVSPEVDVYVATSLADAVGAADIVSCATSSATPLLLGNWIKPGTLIDLVGSFSPTTREADDETVRRSRIFVDTFSGALTEAGDLIDPLKRGIITRKQIEAELADLVSGRARGRSNNEEITLFKSVGTAIEDIAAAQLIIADALKLNQMIPSR